MEDVHHVGEGGEQSITICAVTKPHCPAGHGFLLRWVEVMVMDRTKPNRQGNLVSRMATHPHFISGQSDSILHLKTVYISNVIRKFRLA